MPSPGAMSHQNKFHSVTRPTHSLFVWQGKQIGGHFLLPEKVTSCDAPLALRLLKAFVLPRTSAPTGATPGLQGRTAPASPGSTWEASLSPGNGRCQGCTLMGCGWWLPASSWDSSGGPGGEHIFACFFLCLVLCPLLRPGLPESLCHSDMNENLPSGSAPKKLQGSRPC